MDADLKHKYAPRRNKRYGHLPDFNALCDWAKKLDWENNDAHFLVLANRVVENLDDELREERGMRIDQIASRDELMQAMRYAASWYEPAFRNIFIHLRLYVYFYLGDKLAVKEEPYGSFQILKMRLNKTMDANRRHLAPLGAALELGSMIYASSSFSAAVGHFFR